MNDRIDIGPAKEEEIAHFMRRRAHDAFSERLYRYVAANAPNGVQIARDEGTPIGIAIAHALESEWQLSDIFVEESFRNAGIGFALLKAAAEGAGDVNRSGVIDANSAEAIAFYGKRGVPLQTPLLRISGSLPREEELARMAAGQYRFSTEPVDPQRHSSILAELDREVRGSARQLDHEFFATRAKGFVFTSNGELAAYAYIWPEGIVGPVALAANAYAVQVLGFCLAALHATYAAQWCSLLVPGTNVRVIRALLLADLEVKESAIFASDLSAADSSRYIALHRVLY